MVTALAFNRLAFALTYLVLIYFCIQQSRNLRILPDLRPSDWSSELPSLFPLVALAVSCCS